MKIETGDTYIERVWSKGNEKVFKLVGIMIDEKLKWDEHINYINRKVVSLFIVLSLKIKLLLSLIVQRCLMWFGELLCRLVCI